MEKLVIRLGEHASDPIHWLIWSAAGDEVIASGELKNEHELSVLTAHANTRDVVALVPASAVLLKWVSLPKKVTNKVLSAIPYMLEEELTQDISTQFFAIGPRKNGQQAVAVVARRAMQQWLQWLADAGIHATRMVPDVLAIPHHESKVSLVALGDAWLLRQDEWQGMQGEMLWLSAGLSHLAEQSDGGLTLVNYSQLDVVDVTGLSVEQAPLDLPLLLMARHVETVSFNLLQGDFKLKRRRSGQLHQWRIAAVLAVLALTTSVVDKALSLSRLSADNAAVSQQIDVTVKKHFPNLGAYRDVKRRLEAELERLQQTGGSPSMLTTLAQLSDAFKTASVRPQTLRFDAQRSELRMQLEGANFESLERFKKLSEQAGFTVEEGAINNRDNRVVGTLALRRTI